MSDVEGFGKTVTDLDSEAAFAVGQMVRIGTGAKVYRVWKLHPPTTDPLNPHNVRKHWLYRVEPAGSMHPNGAVRNPRGTCLFRENELHSV